MLVRFSSFAPSFRRSMGGVECRNRVFLLYHDVVILPGWRSTRRSSRRSRLQGCSVTAGWVSIDYAKSQRYMAGNRSVGAKTSPKFRKDSDRKPSRSIPNNGSPFSLELLLIISLSSPSVPMLEPCLTVPCEIWPPLSSVGFRCEKEKTAQGRTAAPCGPASLHCFGSQTFVRRLRARDR